MNKQGQLQDEKEDSQMREILQRKDAKIELQQTMLALQREEMIKRFELEKEKLVFTREEVEMRKEQTKVEMLKTEAHFMGQDLDKLAPHLKKGVLHLHPTRDYGASRDSNPFWQQQFIGRGCA